MATEAPCEQAQRPIESPPTLAPGLSPTAQRGRGGQASAQECARSRGRARDSTKPLSTRAWEGHRPSSLTPPPAFSQTRGRAGRALSIFHSKLCLCSRCLRVGAEGEARLSQEPVPRAEDAGMGQCRLGVGVFVGCLPQPALMALTLTSGALAWSQRLKGTGGPELPCIQVKVGNAGYPTYSPRSVPAHQNSHTHPAP